MRVTPFVREALAVRREARDMKRAGFQRCEPSWEIHRGYRQRERIEGVHISVDGKYVWFRLSGDAPPASQNEG